MDKKTFDTICMDCACRWLDQYLCKNITMYGLKRKYSAMVEMCAEFAKVGNVEWLGVLNDVYEYLNNGTDGEFFGSND